MKYPPFKPFPGEPGVPVVDNPEPRERPPVNFTAIAIIAAAVLFVFRNEVTDLVVPRPGPVVPSPVVPGPAVAPLASIAAIADRAEDKQAVQAAGELYLAMAETVARVESISSEQMQAWLTGSNTLRFVGTDYVGKLPGFGEAANAACVEAIGLESRQLTKEDISKIALLCRQIAAACGVTG